MVIFLGHIFVCLRYLPFFVKKKIHLLEVCPFINVIQRIKLCVCRPEDNLDLELVPQAVSNFLVSSFFFLSFFFLTGQELVGRRGWQ